jgi:hypothetical protein
MPSSLYAAQNLVVVFKTSGSADQNAAPHDPSLSWRAPGWPPTTRAQFDAVRGPTGALLVGDAETVAEKILYDNAVLGGISRVTFQMGVSTLPHEKMMRAIEILGTRVAPIVRKELAAAHPARKVASRK